MGLAHAGKYLHTLVHRFQYQAKSRILLRKCWAVLVSDRICNCYDRYNVAAEFEDRVIGLFVCN